MHDFLSFFAEVAGTASATYSMLAAAPRARLTDASPVDEMSSPPVPFRMFLPRLTSSDVEQ